MTPDMLLLCRTVELGIEPLRKTVASMGWAGTEHLRLNELISSVGGVEAALKDERFRFALRIAFLTAYKENHDSLDGLGVVLLNRLRKTFDEEVALRLCDAALDESETAFKKNDGLIVTREEFDKFNLLDQRTKETFWAKDRFQNYEPQDNHSRLIPCPKCKHPKRVDDKTKKFVCKNPKGCNFSSPFPFTN